MSKRRLTTVLTMVMATMLLAGPAGAKGPKAKKNTATLEAVDTQVKASLPVDLLVDTIRMPKGFDVPKGSVIEVQWRAAPQEGTAWLLVTASRDGEVVRRGFARVDLVAIRPVLVVQCELAKGSVVRADDLMLEPRVGVTGVELDAAALVGSEVLSDLSPGDVVTGANIALPPPVSRGSSISVVAQHGAVKVTAQARLEASARPGERATARIIANRTLVHGRLIDEHTLVVREEEP